MVSKRWAWNGAQQTTNATTTATTEMCTHHIAQMYQLRQYCNESPSWAITITVSHACMQSGLYTGYYTIAAV